jgi:hypothetical protein
MNVLVKFKNGCVHKIAHAGEYYCHLAYGGMVFVEGHGIYAWLGGGFFMFGLILWLMEKLGGADA